MLAEEIIGASSDILIKLKEYGASLGGFARVEDLRNAPSFTFAPKIPNTETGHRDTEWNLPPGEVAWPEHSKTVLVIAVKHPTDEPELDWWFGRIDPPGNRVLASIVTKICGYITKTYGVGTFHLPYHVEKGGTYLKDVAVLAGLGCIGKSNLLITPEFGPRIRLRALTLDFEFPTSGPLNFDPCTTCPEFCRKACPQNAFDVQLFDKRVYNQEILPGIDGSYSPLPAMTK